MLAACILVLELNHVQDYGSVQAASSWLAEASTARGF